MLQYVLKIYNLLLIFAFIIILIPLSFSYSKEIYEYPTIKEKKTTAMEESLRSLHDIVTLHGGKKFDQLKKNWIKKGENFEQFLSRVGYKKNHVTEIITSIKKISKKHDFFRKIPANQLVMFTLPQKLSGGGLEFRINKKFDVYVWQNLNNKFVSKITKRPSKKVFSFKQGSINQNLYNSIKYLNIPKKTFQEMVLILGFVIDFQRDIRKGDKFEVFYEQEIDLINNQTIVTKPISFLSIEIFEKKISYFKYVNKEGIIGYYDELGNSSKKTLMKTPLNGARLSSSYGNRKHPILGYNKFHRGIDFAAPTGTPVFAAGDGIVETAKWNGSYGKYIKIRHNSTFKTAYAHLSKILVRKNKQVFQGQVIGHVGNTGRSTGPHLHYEILVGGKQVNPLTLKIPGGKRLKKIEMVDFLKNIKFIKNKISDYANFE